MGEVKAELVTRSKRPGMDCTLDIYHEKTVGFSKNINDHSTEGSIWYKSEAGVFGYGSIV